MSGTYKADRIWWVSQLDRLLLSPPAWKELKRRWPGALRTYLIAEVGASFVSPLRNALTREPMSKLDCAKAFVRMARYLGHNDSLFGAGAVKYQYWSDSKALALKRRMPEVADRYEFSRLPKAWLPELAKEAESLGVDFMCTTYMKEDIATVAPYVKAFKIASFEAQVWEFIEAHLSYDKPIFISTGLTTEVELINLVEYRTTHPQIKLLHCVSAYPCPYNEVNLAIIQKYGLDGYSDHTGSPITGACAVMAGASIIEVHIRSEFTPNTNPDYPHSLDPETFEQYVSNIMVAEELLGSGQKLTQPAEAANRQYMA